MTAKRRRLWMATGAVLAGILASTYFWWWKPVVLASIRMALEGALARNLPSASFGTLDMAGIQTVVVRDLSYGKPQDDFSLVVPEARFSFSIWHLLTGRLDPVASLKSVVLVGPQVILTLEAINPAESKKGAPGFFLPLPAQAQLGMKNGRILLRSRREKSRFVSLMDMDANAILPSPGTVMFDARFTSPDSPRRGVSTLGVLTPSSLTASVVLKKLRLTPLAPWISRFKPPVAPEMGALSCSLTFSATKTGAGNWSLTRASGKMDADGIALSGPALPFHLREITGSARFDGNSARITALTLLAPDTRWNISGSVDHLGAPVLHLTVESPSFDPGRYVKGAGGMGAVSILADGPIADPVLIVTPDLRDFRLDSFSCARLQGRFTVAYRGKSVLLDPGTVTLGAGVFNAWGLVEPEGPGANLRWTFTPSAAGIPKLAGTASLARGVLTVSTKTSDGIWVATGRARLDKDSWNGSITAHSNSGGQVSATVRAGTKTPFKLSGTMAMEDTPLADLYFTSAWETPGKIKGRLGGTGTLSGNTSNPALVMSLDGRGMELDGEKLALSGSVKITPEAVKLDPLKIGSYASLSMLVPLGNSAVELSGIATGLPVRLALTIGGAPADTLKKAGGSISGKFSGENPGSKDGVFRADLEIQDLSWDTTRLGNGTVIAAGKGSALKFTKLRLNGPVASLDGTGNLEILAGGDWNADTTLTINYLKYGKADLDCQAKVAASSRSGSRTAEASLASVRITGAAYPNAVLTVKSGNDGSSSAKLSWEDLAYISATFKNDAEKSLVLSAALSDFPVAPVSSLFSQPAPADRVSGSVSLKGAQNRAVASASLKWGHGEADARGWIDCTTGKSFSLSLTAVDGALMPWVVFVRSATRFRNMPDLDGRMETRGMALDRDGDSLSINGWVGARELRVGGVLCGNGSLRITSSPAQSEFEASLEGPQGKYTVYPTRITLQGERRSIEGAFAWSGVPLAKAQSSLSRGTLKGSWTDNNASANIIFTGLGLNDRALDQVTVRLDRSGNKWRVFSPKESPWQVIGTVTIAGTRVNVEEDERTGGATLLIRGGDGTTIKAGGTWAPPSAPENFSFEAHRLPAGTLFAALGLPPAEGIAEADLDWKASAMPPLSGRLTLLNAQLGGFPLDSVDTRISGTPGRSFTMSSLKLARGTDFLAHGTGEMVLYPAQSIRLELVVEKLLLRYLQPLGFLDDSDSAARGKITVTGTADEPAMDGTLTCSPGTVKPRTGFSSLYLTEGSLNFTGKKAALSAVLNDITGASVLVNGSADLNRLIPASFTLGLSMPQPVKVDALPGLYRGTAKGEIRFEGTPDAPVLKGNLTLENGQLRTPPAAKKGVKDSFADRMTWDMEVGFGKGVQYVIGAPLGGEIELAKLSPKSLITIKGKGADFKVAGEVLADSGALTLFLGKQLWKK